MKAVFIRAVRKTIILLLFLSILTLMLNLFLPIITLTESTEPNKVQYFNFETMKYSSDREILELSGDINFVNILLWAVIIIGIVSFIGLIISISEKYSKVGNGVLFGCCSIIIFSILSSAFFFLFTKKVIDMDTITLANIFEPIRYVYIQIILLIFLTICSTAYVFLIAMTYIRKTKEKKTSNKEEGKKEPLDEPKQYMHKEKITQWRLDETKKLDKLEPEKAIINDEEKKILETKPKDEEIEFEAKLIEEETEEEKPKTPFVKEKEIEPLEIKEPDKKTKEFYESFENALNSAVRKKQIKKEDQKTDEKIIEPKKEILKPQGKQFNVRCPQCEEIFSAEKSEGVTKIKCPHCGKEGVIK
jgi:hypothetical protein